jgi:[NiFe] hydrogenase assembly HybE family chaperone
MTDHPRVATLLHVYRTADATMRDLPIYNRDLGIEAHGFRSLDGDSLAGILITPWFMNLVLLPQQFEPLDPARYGEGRKVDFPAGARRFRYAGDAVIGAIWTSALHSPMDVFRSQPQARAEARLRMTEAMTPPAADRDAKPCPSRRSFFTGGAGAQA